MTLIYDGQGGGKKTTNRKQGESSWKERLREALHDGTMYPKSGIKYHVLCDFIESLLTEERERVVSEVEKIVKENYESFAYVDTIKRHNLLLEALNKLRNS